MNLIAHIYMLCLGCAENAITILYTVLDELYGYFSYFRNCLIHFGLNMFKQRNIAVA